VGHVALIPLFGSPPRQLSFDEARGFLVRKIKSERSEKKITQWDNELRKAANIKAMPDKVEGKL